MLQYLPRLLQVHLKLLAYHFECACVRACVNTCVTEARKRQQQSGQPSTSAPGVFEVVIS